MYSTFRDIMNPLAVNTDIAIEEIQFGSTLLNEKELLPVAILMIDYGKSFSANPG